MRKRIAAAIGTGLVVLTVAIVNALPTQSQQDVESRVRALGVPEDAVLGVVAGDNRGNFYEVTYFDSSGKEHSLVHLEAPEATPTPQPATR